MLSQFTVWLDHRIVFSIDVNGVTHPLKLGLEDDPVMLAEVRALVRGTRNMHCCLQNAFKRASKLEWRSLSHTFSLLISFQITHASTRHQGGLPRVCAERKLRRLLRGQSMTRASGQ